MLSHQDQKRQGVSSRTPGVLAMKEIKYTLWQGRIKWSLCIDDVILYAENPKRSTIKVLELSNHKLRDTRLISKSLLISYILQITK